MMDRDDPKIVSLYDTLTTEQKHEFEKLVRRQRIADRMRENRLTLDDIEASAPNWICKNVLAENYMSMLAGEGGAGKSSFAISLAAWITYTKGLGVYYYSTETRFEGQVKAQFLAQNGIPELFSLDRADDVTMADFEAFNEIMTDAKRDVLIIDHLFDYTPSGKDLNNAQDVVDVLRPLKLAVGASNGKSALVIHHLNKDGRVHGSAQIPAQFRHVVKLNNTDTDDKIAEIEKTNLGKANIEMRCRVDEMKIPGGKAGIMVWANGQNTPQYWETKS